MSIRSRLALAALLLAFASAAITPAIADPNDGIWGGRGGGNHALAMAYTPIIWGTYNVAYTGSTPFTTGGTGPYTYSMQAGTLPTGITLNTSTGVISGTDSTDSGGHTSSGLVLRVTDSAGTPAHVDSSSFSIAIAATLTMSYTPVTSATYNVAYTGATPSASGGTAPYVYTNTGGVIPTGMTISSSTGVISGTDSTDSGGLAYGSINVAVTDAHARVVMSSPFTITVAGAPALSMSYTPVTTGTVGVLYTGATPSTSGGISAYTYSIFAGALPAGTTLNTSTGVISGTPTTAATYSGITLRVTDTVPNHIDSSPFTVTIGASGGASEPFPVVFYENENETFDSNRLRAGRHPMASICLRRPALHGRIGNNAL